MARETKVEEMQDMAQTDGKRAAATMKRRGCEPVSGFSGVQQVCPRVAVVSKEGVARIVGLDAARTTTKVHVDPGYG